MSSLSDTPHLQQQDDTQRCFHCGEPIRTATPLTVHFHDSEQAVCCHGCQAVATAILEGGFEAYYAKRRAYATTADLPDTNRFASYDDPGFQAHAVRTLKSGDLEVTLSLDGLHCPSCVWLAERAVNCLPGVASFEVNVMTRRARLCWQAAHLKLSTVLQALADVGLPSTVFDQAKRDAQTDQAHRAALRRLFVSGMGMMQVMMYVVPHYMFGADIEPEFLRLMQWASFWLTLPVITYASWPMLAGAARDLNQRRIGMDVPIAIGLVAAFIGSAWHTWIGQGEVYYDSITMFVFLLTCGRMLEASARRRAVEALDDFLRMQPERAKRIDAKGAIEEVDITALDIGDTVMVGSSEMLPADGTLVEASAELDVSLLTGESRPVHRQMGEMLPAGAVNCGAAIHLRVARQQADNTLSAMRRLVDRASSERPRIARLADKVAQIFLSALLLFAIGVALVWWHIDASRALPIAISVLVVSCPCALSLATPAVIAAVTTNLARRGILISRANAIETLASADQIVFDKTGTLTQAQPALSAITIAPGNTQTETEMLQLAAALEQGSGHPLGKAICAAAKGLDLPAVSDRQLHAGQGLEACIHGMRYRIGRAAFVAPNRLDDAPPSLGLTRIALGTDQGVLAWFTLAAPLRQGADSLARELSQLGLHSHLMSGDHTLTARAVGNQLGITAITGDMLPEDKLAAVKTLQQAGHIVAMVGDGINDAPVLSGADVSIALRDGTELAQVAADIVLMGDDLSAIPAGIKLARQAMRVVRQNLWWAAIYNVVAIPAAAFGYVTPWIAAVGMSASSLFVVLNALRLLRKKTWKASIY